MTEERLEIGKYSNLSSSYHLLAVCCIGMERSESMYKVCTYVFVSHCVPFRESNNNQKIISLHPKKHPPHPKNTSFIHSPKPTRYKTFCNLIALSHETAASEKVALHEHENRCEGEWIEMRKKESEKEEEKFFHEMMIIPENVFIHRGMFLYVWVDC
jgi:hypothetical protein